MQKYKLILGYELKKIVMTKITTVTILISTTFLFFVSIQNFLTMPFLRDSWKDEHFLDGQIMDDSFFNKIRQTYHENDDNNPYRFVMRYLHWATGSMSNHYDTLTETDILNLTQEQFYERRIDMIAAYKDTYFLTEKERDYWDRAEEKIEKPFVYRSTQGALQMWDSYMWNFILTSFAIAICLSQTFAGEHAHRTDALIYCTTVGQKQLCVIKLIAGILFSLITGILFLIVNHLPVFLYSGLHGLNGAWQLISPFSQINKTIGEMLFVHTVIYLLACIMISIIVMLLSLLLRNGIPTMGLVFAFLMLDLLIGFPTSLRFLSQIKALTPVGVLANSFVPDYRLTEIAGTYLTNYQTAMISYAVISVILTFVLIQTYKRRIMNLK